ncbi:MAG: hypothetical protein ACR2HA_03500, partial [Nocardioides sp.]
LSRLLELLLADEAPRVDHGPSGQRELLGRVRAGLGTGDVNLAERLDRPAGPPNPDSSLVVSGGGR